MAVNLSIKGVPEALAAQLRERALRNHCSLQGEPMALIAAAVSEPAAGPAAPRVLQRPPHGADPAGRAVWRRGTRTIENVAADHRRAFPAPIEGGRRRSTSSAACATADEGRRTPIRCHPTARPARSSRIRPIWLGSANWPTATNSRPMKPPTCGWPPRSGRRSSRSIASSVRRRSRTCHGPHDPR